MQVEQVAELRFNEMMDLVAMSEVITGIQVDLQPWLDPEGYEKKMARSAKMQKRMMQEQEVGMNVNPKMKDPAFRRKLIEQAQESRERLREHKVHKGTDLEAMNAQLARAKNA
jgi:hypothetical protein